jgi:hypothetical protein
MFQSETQTGVAQTDGWKKEVLPYIQIWKKLVPNASIFDSTPKKTTTDIWLNFLLQEANYALSLMRNIHLDFVAIAKMLKGGQSVDTSLEAVCKALAQNMIPASYTSSLVINRTDLTL